MAYDYTDDVAFAVEMIADFGGAVTFRALKEGAPTDPDRPLDEPTGTNTDVTATAVFVGKSDADLGFIENWREFFKDCRRVCLVAPDGTNDFTTFDQVVEGNIVTKIINALKFQPRPDVGPAILYVVGVAK